MPGIFERLSTLAGSEIEKAADIAHRTFQHGVADHGHHGRALVETLARLCRDHPNLVGIGVGVLVEQLLMEEKRVHDHKRESPTAVAPPTDGATADGATAAAAPADNDPFALEPLSGDRPALAAAPIAPPLQASRPAAPHRIRPVRLALEVFGGLLLLKFGHAFSRILRRRHPHDDSWFSAAARIHALSAAIATYCFASGLRSRRVSAWRNAAIGLFGTDALKPLLKAYRPLRQAA